MQPICKDFSENCNGQPIKIFSAINTPKDKALFLLSCSLFLFHE